jgi:hydrogenase maturation factor
VAHQAVRIGTITVESPSLVVLQTVLGTHHILDRLSGEQLSRIG